MADYILVQSYSGNGVKKYIFQTGRQADSYFLLFVISSRRRIGASTNGFYVLRKTLRLCDFASEQMSKINPRLQWKESSQRREDAKNYFDVPCFSI